MAHSRFVETFRERMPEWALSLCMVGWGLATLLADQLFVVQAFFHPLLILMDQNMWGVIVTLLGITRLVFLVINGAWRPSAHIRAIGCGFGTILWGSLLIASLSLAWLTPTLVVYACMLLLDLISLWFSAGDAKLADMAAKSKPSN